jgi:hypothetical protein
MINKGDALPLDMTAFVTHMQSGKYVLPTTVIAGRTVTAEHLQLLKFINPARISTDIADMYLELIKTCTKALDGVTCLGHAASDMCAGTGQLSFARLEKSETDLSQSQGMFKTLLIPWRCDGGFPFPAFVRVMPQAGRVSTKYDHVVNAQRFQLGVQYRIYIFEHVKVKTNVIQCPTVNEDRVREVRARCCRARYVIDKEESWLSCYTCAAGGMS